jgi:hypothetical protein
VGSIHIHGKISRPLITAVNVPGLSPWRRRTAHEQTPEHCLLDEITQ